MKDFRKWMLLICPFIIAGAVFLYQGTQVLPGELTDDGHPLDTFFYAFGAFFIVLPFLLYGGLMLLVFFFGTKESELKQQGIKGTATILETEQTGVFINENPQVKFKLQVEIPGRPPFEVLHRQVVELIHLYAIAPGSVHTVYVDPANAHSLLLIL